MSTRSSSKLIGLMNFALLECIELVVNPAFLGLSHSSDAVRTSYETKPAVDDFAAANSSLNVNLDRQDRHLVLMKLLLSCQWSLAAVSVQAVLM